MAIQLATYIRNARLDAIENTANTGAVCKLRTGVPPANCAAADTGTVIVTIQCPDDWMGAANAGAKAKAGTWSDNSADTTGVPEHFRLYSFGGTNCIIQGTVSQTGAGGFDMLINNMSIVGGQVVTVDTFTLTDGNA